MQFLGLAALGVLSGALSGLTGIGGGIIIVPALVYLFGYSMHVAQGTTIALLVPPIGILAAWAYYQRGYVDIHAAVVIAIGFVLGSFMSARVVQGLSEDSLRKTFAVILVVVAAKMFVSKA